MCGGKQKSKREVLTGYLVRGNLNVATNDVDARFQVSRVPAATSQSGLRATFLHFDNCIQREVEKTSKFKGNTQAHVIARSNPARERCALYPSSNRVAVLRVVWFECL